MHFLSHLPNDLKVAIFTVFLVALVAGIFVLRTRLSRGRHDGRRPPG